MSDHCLITVFSDATFKDGKSAHHFWWKSERGCINGSGTEAEVAGSCEAELYGILEGINSADAHHLDIDTKNISWVIQCDSLEALGALITLVGAKQARTSPTTIPPGKKFRPTVKKVCGYIKTTLGGRLVWLKHVKGHTKHTDSRHRINRQNDHGARKAYQEKWNTKEKVALP